MWPSTLYELSIYYECFSDRNTLNQTVIILLQVFFPSSKTCFSWSISLNFLINLNKLCTDFQCCLIHEFFNKDNKETLGQSPKSRFLIWNTVNQGKYSCFVIDTFYWSWLMRYQVRDMSESLSILEWFFSFFLNVKTYSKCVLHSCCLVPSGRRNKEKETLALHLVQRVVLRIGDVTYIFIYTLYV